MNLPIWHHVSTYLNAFQGIIESIEIYMNISTKRLRCLWEIVELSEISLFLERLLIGKLQEI